ncbi:AUGMIN subunit 7 [Camellia lanceoleosa]|uniref:AUGMIN subunit 7 n=1 Tax=Camellia lanceoleosa TaxID=1840588 RepID=A0ACC0H373_9ERIC|nr:AUGMIN subunit 7 [Camellia lanceoleosa]
MSQTHLNRSFMSPNHKPTSKSHKPVVIIQSDRALWVFFYGFYLLLDEDYVEVEAKLRGHLESFLEIARSFNMIYTKEARPWTHMMDVPQLHGFGPTANCLITNGLNFFTLDFAFM